MSEEVLAVELIPFQKLACVFIVTCSTSHHTTTHFGLNLVLHDFFHYPDMFGIALTIHSLLS